MTYTATATTVLKNRYQMGSVIQTHPLDYLYQGIDLQTQQPVIIHTLAPEITKHPQYNKGKYIFSSIARQLFQARHAHLPEIVAVFEEDNLPYMVSADCQGKPILQLITPATALPEETAIRYIRQVASALQLLHQSGLQHQNISPQTLLYVSSKDRMILTGWSFRRYLQFLHPLSNTLSEISAQHPFHHQPPIPVSPSLQDLIPGYSPLEQYQTKPTITPASDIYSLSAIFYYFLVGIPPLPAMLRTYITTEEWQQFPNFIDPLLKQTIYKGLELNVQDRPQTVAQWLATFPVLQKTVTLPTFNPPTTQPVTKVYTPKPDPEDTVKNSQLSWSLSHSFSLFPSSLWKFLLLTSMVATSMGFGFGHALKITLNQQKEASKKPLILIRQDFPPRENWPIIHTGENSFIKY